MLLPFCFFHERNVLCYRIIKDHVNFLHEIGTKWTANTLNKKKDIYIKTGIYSYLTAEK